MIVIELQGLKRDLIAEILEIFGEFFSPKFRVFAAKPASKDAS